MLYYWQGVRKVVVQAHEEHRVERVVHGDVPPVEAGEESD